MMNRHFDFDIPFVWTAVFHWLSYMLFITLLPKRLSRLATAVVAFLFLAAQIALFSLIAPLQGMMFNLGMTLFALWTLIPFLLLIAGPLTNLVYYCARAFILGGFAVSLAWQLYRFYSERSAVLMQPDRQIVFELAVGLVVFPLIWLLERRHRAELREMLVEPPSVIEAVAIALIIYIASSLSYTALDTPFTGKSEAEIFNIRTIVYFGGAAILYALHLQLCGNYAQSERDALQHILDQQYTNYRMEQESVDLVNRKYHDLKHQISVLRAGLGDAQKTEYLDQLEQEIRTYEAQNKTGNEVLDTILTSKSIYCQTHGITLTVVADGHALDFMNVMDLSALFGNMLDNAIEAAERVEESEQRLILLSVSRQKGFLRVQIKNRYPEGPTFRGVLPETTKADKRFHGYGLKSIRYTVEKYGGSIAVHGEDGWFELGLLIPLPESDEAAS